MTALPSPGKVVRSIFQYSDTSDTNILNRLYFSYSGSVSSADLSSWNSTLATEWSAEVKGKITDNVTLENITSTDLSSDLGAEVETPVGTAGSGSGTYLPSSSCVVLRAAISRRYRGGHPRVYIAGIAQNWLTNADTWNATDVNGLAVAWATMISDAIADAPADFGTTGNVNVSYYSGFEAIKNPITGRYRNVPQLRATPTVDVINGWSANPKVGSQRRRNEQRG